ncbi:MAG: dCMP deaminase family protein [Deltaproteobacteria bacterium]|jgi:dCMP deaminase|nr:dCMP deaminase family protein [Deltaproteobacteria bacterium]
MTYPKQSLYDDINPNLPDYFTQKTDPNGQSKWTINERLIPRPNWNEYFMAMAKVTSTRSTCSSRPVGCVITRENRIIVTGYNGAPPGEPHCTDQSHDGKLYCARRAEKVPDTLKHNFCHSLHAEENALALADRLNIAELLEGGTIYITLSPCEKCIRNLKAHGIVRVYYELAYNSIDASRDSHWEKMAKEYFEVYEQLTISRDSMLKILGSVLEVTSQRHLPSE